MTNEPTHLEAVSPGQSILVLKTGQVQQPRTAVVLVITQLDILPSQGKRAALTRYDDARMYTYGSNSRCEATYAGLRRVLEDR